MPQRRDHAKLALEPQHRVRCCSAAHLDRDVHVAALIAPEIDHAHAASTELADDAIAVADDRPDALGRGHAIRTLTPLRRFALAIRILGELLAVAGVAPRVGLARVRALRVA